MTTSPSLRIKSRKFRILPGEKEELVNDGVYGKACAQYLQSQLPYHGYEVPFVVCEDWGWWVEVLGMNFTCGVGVYGMQIDDSEELDLCVIVLTPHGKKWSWAKFRSIDTRGVVRMLHDTIRKIFQDDPEVTVVSESSEFPLLR